MTRFGSGPQESPGFLLWHLTSSWQRSIVAALKPTGLSHVQFVILACVWWLCSQGDAPNQQQVACFAGTDVKTTSHVLRGLEERGLLERRTDDRDSRAKTILITGSGAQLAGEAIEAVETTDQAFFAARPPALLRGLLQTGRPD